ncbi:MAG: type I-F CRISPR-associated protein Csy1 [Rhodoferax sp.]|nr:type I-F CRISPR-associated protein Csy1 [Rhodoferax sp.]
MPTYPDLGRVASLQLLIEQFLSERLNGKLEKLAPDDPKRTELQAQFIPAIWLDDAARRVVQIQAVTHSLKPIHPDAKGSSLYREPATLHPSAAVGTHSLGKAFAADVVGNAAALDVYKFLKLSHDGHSLLELAVQGDADLTAALTDNTVLAQQWMAAFASLAEARGTASSHTNAKQLYWLVGNGAHDDGAFHLLAPLYPTSLVHRVYQQIQDDRFSEDVKAARAARKAGNYHSRPVREYPQLAIQKLGGTKPQNISQLNSERRGDNCLLASIPPIWKSEDVRPLLRVSSLFKVYGRRRAVAQQARALRLFLQGDPPRNKPTRRQVQEWVQSLIDELVLFQAELFTLAPGWSQADECRLSAGQRAWLDPLGQALGAMDQDDGADTVAADFARWVNAQLRDPLPVGDREFLEWRKLAAEQLAAHEREAA